MPFVVKGLHAPPGNGIYLLSKRVNGSILCPHICQMFHRGWWADTVAAAFYFDVGKTKRARCPVCDPVGECAVKASVLIRRGGVPN